MIRHSLQQQEAAGRRNYVYTPGQNFELYVGAAYEYADWGGFGDEPTSAHQVLEAAIRSWGEHYDKVVDGFEIPSTIATDLGRKALSAAIEAHEEFDVFWRVDVWPSVLVEQEVKSVLAA